MLKMRKSIVDERIELQRLKHEIKLLQIVKPEMSLLNEWAKMEKNYYEAVGKLATKLWAHATRLPLREGAKVYLNFYKLALLFFFFFFTSISILFL